MIAAFYKGDKAIFNKVVRWWDDGPYSHMELVLIDGQCLSSSFMDDGVRSKQIVFDDNKWDFIDLSRIFDELPVLEYFIKNKGVKYDLLGTLGFILGPTQRDNKLFCSEFCMSALGFKEAWRLSPNASFQVLLWKLSQLGDVIKTVNNGNYNYRLLPAR